MKSVKGAIVLTAIIATAVVGACRREVEHKPMKLGADVSAAEQVKR